MTLPFALCPLPVAVQAFYEIELMLGKLQERTQRVL